MGSKSGNSLFTNSKGITMMPAGFIHPGKYKVSELNGTEAKNDAMLNFLKKGKFKNSTDFAEQLTKFTGFHFEPADGMGEEEDK